MKAWLPILVEELKAGNSPVLVISSIRNLARAAVFNGQGLLLAGGLGSPSLQHIGSTEASKMSPGQRLMIKEANLIIERLDSSDHVCIQFWESNLDNNNGAWASWLLTMPRLNEDGQLALPRHLLSAFGPWTTPRLPEEFKEHWSLLPLKAGLGRLFVIGDDALAMESAALGARAGLTVTWYSSAAQEGPDLDEALLMADFQLIKIDGWQALTEEFIAENGFTEGVHVLVTCSGNEGFIDFIKKRNPAYLALAGEAETDTASSGLFPKALTTSHKALGLIAEMLS